jgi:hypothetical protein
MNVMLGFSYCRFTSSKSDVFPFQSHILVKIAAQLCQKALLHLLKESDILFGFPPTDLIIVQLSFQKLYLSVKV